MKRLQAPAILPNHALIEVALLERPLGDEYINEELWQHADELIVDLDRRAALDENGIRLGQLVGSPPSEFQQLLLSKRYCSNPQALIFPAGKTVPIMLGSVLPIAHSSYGYVEGKSRTEVSLDKVRYLLDVTASFMSDGRTKLTFSPKVENGEPILPFQASPDKSIWEVRVEKACKKYPDLSWDVTLAPNQYLIVGTRLERERTLGHTALTEFVNESSVQRLLVIRNCRSVTAGEAQQNSVEALVRADHTLPLALQATIPVSRAKAN